MPKITIYTTPVCVYCKLAKAFFKEHHLAYEEHDVSIDEAARDRMIAKSGQMGVPVIDINGRIVPGFDKKRLMDILFIQ